VAIVPEIPELRAHAERLTETYGGARLERFRALSFTALKTFSPPPEEAAGRALDGVTQRGKYLRLHFGDVAFVVHLMQGGRLRDDAKQARKPRGGLGRWSFADGRALLLTEPGTEHRAGIWVVSGDPDDQEPISHIGPEADSLDGPALHGLLGAHSMRLHGFLRNQRILAGVGRRLANEVCYAARLSPFVMTSKLGAADADALVAAIAETVADGIAYDRTRADMSSSADRPSIVHGRAGQRCPDCDCADEIRSVTYRRYRVDYCPARQTEGRVLADNVTSKFLK
jgi:formamidopyrimidine-DNA glycosylase